MYQKTPSLKWLVALHVVLISLVTVTLASAHGGDTALIHACVHKSSGEIMIIGENATCPRNYYALDWNIQGPAGQQGPQGLPGEPGPQGIQGIQGLQGPAGISGLEVVSNTSASNPLDRHYISGSAACPTGKKVIGGGYELGGDFNGALVTSNRPSISVDPPGEGWHVAGERFTHTNDWTITVWVICAYVAP